MPHEALPDVWKAIAIAAFVASHSWIPGSTDAVAVTDAADAMMQDFKRQLAAKRRAIAMPIDERRQEALAAAVAAYNKANPLTPLPRNAARLLIAMFAADDVCQRSLLDLAVDGFAMSRLPGTLRRLVAVGLLSRHRVAGAPDTYRLHLPRA
jgi:hypothetical protein